MTNKTFDLADLDTGKACDKGAEIELLHPVTSEPLGIYVTVLGKDSAVFREHLRESINQKIRLEAMAKKRGRDPAPATVEVGEAEAVELLIVCTVGWRNMVLNGTDLPFTVANAQRVYTDHLWIRKQVDEAIANLENFMRA